MAYEPSILQGTAGAAVRGLQSGLRSGPRAGRPYQHRGAPRPRHRRYDPRPRPPLVPSGTVPAVDLVCAGRCLSRMQGNLTYGSERAVRPARLPDPVSKPSSLQAGTGSADGRLAGATLLSEVGACGRRKLGSGEGPVHQSLRVRGRRSSKLVRSPLRVCRCHRCPASLPDASAGAELVIAPEPPDPGPAALRAVAILAVDPIVGAPHLGARVSRRAKPPAQPALALTPEHPDAAL